MKHGEKPQKISGWFKDKPLKCGCRYEFRDQGSRRVIEEIGVCENKEERWKKILKEAKSWAPLVNNMI